MACNNSFDEKYELKRQQWLGEAVEEESYYVKSFQDEPKVLNIGVVITYLSKGKTAPQNAALVIKHTGDSLLKYSKIHTCDFSLATLLES